MVGGGGDRGVADWSRLGGLLVVCVVDGEDGLGQPTRGGSGL